MYVTGSSGLMLNSSDFIICVSAAAVPKDVYKRQKQAGL